MFGHAVNSKCDMYNVMYVACIYCIHMLHVHTSI